MCLIDQYQRPEFEISTLFKGIFVATNPSEFLGLPLCFNVDSIVVFVITFIDLPDLDFHFSM